MSMIKLSNYLSTRRELTIRLGKHLNANFTLVSKKRSLHDLFHAVARASILNGAVKAI